MADEKNEKEQSIRRVPPIRSSTLPSLQFLTQFMGPEAERRDVYEVAMQQAYDHLILTNRPKTALSVLFRLFDASVRESLMMMRVRARRADRTVEIPPAPSESKPIPDQIDPKSISDADLKKIVFGEPNE